MEKENRIKRNQEILKSYNLGYSYSKIAETFGMSKGGVHKIIQAILNGKEIPDIDSEAKINVQSLRDIAIYLQGIKDGKGNLLPLGNVVLDDLWDAISILNKKSTASGEDVEETAAEVLQGQSN